MRARRSSNQRSSSQSLTFTGTPSVGKNDHLKVGGCVLVSGERCGIGEQRELAVGHTQAVVACDSREAGRHEQLVRFSQIVQVFSALSRSDYLHLTMRPPLPALWLCAAAGTCAARCRARSASSRLRKEVKAVDDRQHVVGRRVEDRVEVGRAGPRDFGTEDHLVDAALLDRGGEEVRVVGAGIEEQVFRGVDPLLGAFLTFAAGLPPPPSPLSVGIVGRAVRLHDRVDRRVLHQRARLSAPPQWQTTTRSLGK